MAIQSRATSGFARNWRNIASWGVGLPGFFFRSVKLALAGAPFVLALSALVPVGWSTWITRSLADQAEKAGFIQVAVIQLANTCGAAVGGFTLDRLGLVSPLIPSGTLMLLTALLVTVKVKIKP